MSPNRVKVKEVYIGESDEDKSRSRAIGTNNQRSMENLNLNEYRQSSMLNNGDIKMQQQIRNKMTQSLDPQNYDQDSMSPRTNKYGIIKTGESMKEYNRLIVQ